MLSTETELAKKVVLSERPVINEDQVAFEPALLDNLILNISMVSSIFHKQSESLIPKVIVAVAKRVPEEDDEEVTSPSSTNDTQVKDDHKNKEEIKPKEDEKKIKEAPKKKIEIPKPGAKVTPNKEIETKAIPKVNNLIDLLDDTPIETKPTPVIINKPNNNGGDLLDFLESPSPSTQISQINNSSNNSSPSIDFSSVPQKIENPSPIFQNVTTFETATPVPYEVKYLMNLLLMKIGCFQRKHCRLSKRQKWSQNRRSIFKRESKNCAWFKNNKFH